MAEVLGGTHAGDLGRGMEQRPGGLTGDHIGLVAVGDGDHHVGIVGAGALQHVGVRGSALHSADIQAVLQFAQQPVVFGIGDDRVVEDVVAVIVFVELFVQLPDGQVPDGVQGFDASGRTVNAGTAMEPIFWSQSENRRSRMRMTPLSL